MTETRLQDNSTTSSTDEVFDPIKNPNKKPSWECVMETYDPNALTYGASKATGGRPRRCSLHTLASVTGRDIRVIAKEMAESKKVHGYRCPDVKTLIFYLDRLKSVPGMIHSANSDPNSPGPKANVWKLVDQNLTENPYPKIKGFKRFSGSGSSGMEHTFLPEDMDYAMAIKANLEKHGFKPSEIFECTDCMCASK